MNIRMIYLGVPWRTPYFRIFEEPPRYNCWTLPFVVDLPIVDMVIFQFANPRRSKKRTIHCSDHRLFQPRPSWILKPEVILVKHMWIRVYIYSVYIYIYYIYIYIIHTNITLHYITLQFITLHYSTLHCSTLHYITLHCIALHYITLHYIALHYSTVHAIALHYITIHYATLHYVTSHYITLV